VIVLPKNGERVSVFQAPNHLSCIISIAPWVGWAKLWTIKPMAWANPTVTKIKSRKHCLIDAGIFSRRSTLFFDTTSIYFEGEGGQTLGEHGHSKDHRPDLKQMIVGLALDVQGRPICCQMWPGNTTDVKTLIPVVKDIKRRFGVHHICIVADRGMMSKQVVKALESQQVPCTYILGVRMRRVKDIAEHVLKSPKPFF